MKKFFIIFISLIVVFVLCFLFLFFPEVKMYYKFYSNSTIKYSYYVKEKNVNFSELFFDPESKPVEIYGIDDFNYLIIDEAITNPDILTSFIATDENIFDGKTIDELMDILRNCEYIPIDRREAFAINSNLKSNMIVTIISLSSYWFNKENPLYSVEYVDELINKGYGIIYGEIYEYDNKIYLVAEFADKVCYSQRFETKIIKMNETKRCVYEIKKTDISKRLLNQKFRVNEKQALMVK